MIRVLKNGILDTVQDLGRPGYAAWGIGPGGAADPYGAQLANRLVGNEVTAALLEMHFPAATLRFEKDALVALTGADFSPALDETELASGRPVVVRAGSVLRFRGLRQGARVYLSVYGGLATSPWLGSCSTHLRAGVGGLEGRALQTGDIIPFPPAPRRFTRLVGLDKPGYVLPWGIRPAEPEGGPLLFIPGPEWTYLSKEVRAEFPAKTFAVQAASDRMGMRLESEAIQLVENVQLISSGIARGTIQLLPNGRIIILQADRATTGGYPRLGGVIAAYWSRLAQLPAGSMLRLQPCSVEEAEKLYLVQQKKLDLLGAALHQRINDFFK